MDLNLRHLRALAAVARTGSVTAAARQVNLTQPAVTQGIGKLELQLGCPLFERRPGGMTATEAGERLAARVDAASRFIASPRVTSTQMRAFVAVARAGSYAEASAMTGLGEASLHRSVGDLSLNIGHRLVERRGRGIALTARGQTVARNFRLAEVELKSGLAEIAEVQGREVGRIAIGAMPLSRARLLPNAIARFHAQHPEIGISIAEGSHAELVGPLRDGDLDVIVGALRHPSIGDDVRQHELFIDRPVIIGRENHPLLKKRRVSPADLAQFDWVVPDETTPLRMQFAQLFDAADIEPPPVAIECGSVMIVRQLLMQSDYLTLLSPDQVAIELKAGWLVKISDAPEHISRTIGYTVRSDWRPTRLQSRFLETLEEESKSLRTRK